MILEDTEHFKKWSVLMEIQKKHILYVTTKIFSHMFTWIKDCQTTDYNDPQQEFFLGVEY